jgi:FkbM family methyltransferase
MSKDCLKYNVKNWILPSSLASFLYTPGELGITLDELDSTPDVKKAYDLLADEKSRLVFKDFIRLQTCCKQDLFSHYEPNQYFCKNLKDKIDYSCFIDAGAYDGDTLQIWLNNVDHGYYYGFEPQLAEYNKLLEYVKNTNVNPNIKIFTYNCGLGAETSNLKMSLTGGVSASFSPSDKASSNITSVENQVKIFKLDDIKLETKPTVIKCDVEGFELNILKGATKTITEKTTLIICVYHKRNDFFELPLYMHSLSPKAKIYMRQHYETYGETVCYAIP